MNDKDDESHVLRAERVDERDQARTAKRAALRAAIEEGENSPAASLEDEATLLGQFRADRTDTPLSDDAAFLSSFGAWQDERSVEATLDDIAHARVFRTE